MQRWRVGGSPAGHTDSNAFPYDPFAQLPAVGIGAVLRKAELPTAIHRAAPTKPLRTTTSLPRPDGPV